MTKLFLFLVAFVAFTHASVLEKRKVDCFKVSSKLSVSSQESEATAYCSSYMVRIAKKTTTQSLCARTPTPTPPAPQPKPEVFSWDKPKSLTTACQCIGIYSYLSSPTVYKVAPTCTSIASDIISDGSFEEVPANQLGDNSNTDDWTVYQDTYFRNEDNGDTNYQTPYGSQFVEMRSPARNTGSSAFAYNVIHDYYQRSKYQWGYSIQVPTAYDSPNGPCDLIVTWSGSGVPQTELDRVSVNTTLVTGNWIQRTGTFDPTSTYSTIYAYWELYGAGCSGPAQNGQTRVLLDNVSAVEMT